jgi:hypothetical protein
MKTNVYIDGFNLYYRAVKDTPYKWLDLSALCQKLLPHDVIHRIRYFTALVNARPDNPHAPQRQLTYLRALRTIPNLTIEYGQFRPRLKARPLHTPIAGLPHIVEVDDVEEKGSDVNLATYLLMDGYENDYEKAAVISNDSDLALPIRMVRDRLNFPVLVVNPNLRPNKMTHDPRKRTADKLREAATDLRWLRESTLKQCQFPPELHDNNGTITKPSQW